MPKAFTDCQAAGGKIRTVKPKAGTYVHVCKAPGANKTVAGEVHHVGSKTTKKRSKSKPKPADSDGDHEYR